MRPMIVCFGELLFFSFFIIEVQQTLLILIITITGHDDHDYEHQWKYI